MSALVAGTGDAVCSALARVARALAGAVLAVGGSQWHSLAGHFVIGRSEGAGAEGGGRCAVSTRVAKGDAGDVVDVGGPARTMHT